MLLTSKGLWIASDNTGGSSQCAGRGGHAGICFLPYGKGRRSGPVPPVPAPPVPVPPVGVTHHPRRWHLPVFPIG
jgi:hypothetical protein